MILLTGFLFINLVAFFHAYRFTHFSDSSSARTESPERLGITQKIGALVSGVKNPKPQNNRIPTREFETVLIQSNKQIECWSIRAETPKGTVILFHGYGSQKSALIERADIFVQLGYNTLLVDFMGSGGSEGNQTTIGFLEATQVYSCYEYIQASGESNIYLFGSSQGAAAIMKAIQDYRIEPQGIVLECPFGSMYETVCARFRNMGVPTFPMSGLLVFWGGVQNGFWAFAHNPSDYALHINRPALLLYGGQDRNVSRQEIDRIYRNLSGTKSLRVYPTAGHEDYLLKYREPWIRDVTEFLNTL